ncbi:hypothetical protein [Streptomyces griseosporeus]|uniref:hypothetical protein n=1 Tax=Streptomyces griseosporeus TaxID=1910 RepID=UPI0036FFFDA7
MPVAEGARDEYAATSITPTLQGREPRSTAGALVDVPLPSRRSPRTPVSVTYWTTVSGAALDFVTSR